MHFDLNELLVFGAFFNSHNFHFESTGEWYAADFVPTYCVAANFKRITRIRWNSNALTVTHAECLHTSVPLYRISFVNRWNCVPLYPFIDTTFIDIWVYLFAIQDNFRNGLNFSMEKRHFSVIPLLRYRVKCKARPTKPCEKENAIC